MRIRPSSYIVKVNLKMYQHQLMMKKIMLRNYIEFSGDFYHKFNKMKYIILNLYLPTSNQSIYNIAESTLGYKKL